MAKKLKMNACLLNEINQAHDHKMDAFKSHIESFETAEAWGLNNRQQCRDEMTGEYFQFIDTKSYKPIKIYADMDGDKDVESDVTVIASQTEDEEMTFLDMNQSKDGRLLWIGIALAVVTLAFLIAILMILKNRTGPPLSTMALMGVSFVAGFVNKEDRKKLKDIKELRKNANAIVIDEAAKERQLRTVEKSSIPFDSFLKEYNGQMFHLLGKKIDGTYWTINQHFNLEENQSPLDYFVAKHCAEEVKETYGISSSAWRKIGIGIFAVLIVVIVIVLFLIVTATSGGTIA